MPHYNYEIKARCPDPESVRAALKRHNADFRGIDQQVDTYFHCPEGRLKLRSGNIEQALIFYKRPNQTGPKTSEVSLHILKNNVSDNKTLLATLTAALGVKVKVAKTREIYFIDNVKIHLDEVPQLGKFVEIEAIDNEAAFGMEHLRKQCNFFMQEFGIHPGDLIDRSYSDMLMEA